MTTSLFNTLELGHISRRKRRKKLDWTGHRPHPPRRTYDRGTLLPPLAARPFAHMVRRLVVVKLQEDIDTVANETRYGSGRVST